MERATEIRAGLVVLAALTLFAGLMWVVVGPRFAGRAAEFTVRLPRVEGLARGGAVRLSGVEIGEVVGLQPQGSDGVAVRVRVPQALALRRGYRYELARGAFLGEPYIEITPVPDAAAGAVLEPGAVVQGTVRPTAEDLITSGYTLLQNLSQVTTQLAEFVGDPQLRETLETVLENVGVASAELAALSRSLRGVVEAEAPRIGATMANVEATSADLSRTAAHIEAIVREVQQRLDETTLFADLEATAGQVRRSAGHIEQLTGELARITEENDLTAETARLLDGFHETLAELQQAAREFQALAREGRAVVGDVGERFQEVTATAERITRVARGITEVKVEPQVQSMVAISGGNPTFTDLNLDFHLENGLGRLGIAGIGSSATLNLQYGFPTGPGRMRLGIVQSEPGVAYDWQGGRRWSLTGEAFDLQRVRANLYLHYLLGVDSGLGLLVGVRDIGAQDLPVLGLQLRR